MGITSFGISLIEDCLKIKDIKNVIELGAQNLYNQDKFPPPFAHEYYNVVGIEYTCIDLNKQNNCLEIDLSKPFEITKQYDLVTDFGTSEHVGNTDFCDPNYVGNNLGKHDLKSFYQCLKNKHDLCKINGIILSNNPKTGHWPDHGFQYYSEEFYIELAKLNNYTIHKLGEYPAMNNTLNGWEIHCILIKNNENFISYEEFQTLPILLS